jgi:pimeloyl-ACP methyl ester carboxylesterase
MAAPHGAIGQEKGAADLLRPARPSLMARIAPEAQHPELGPLAAQYRALPCRTRMCETSIEGKTLRLAIHQLGSGHRARVQVLIHGVISDSETWRYVAGPLAAEYDLWLVDLPGCGASEAPNPAALGPKGYSPTSIAERVLQALRQCLAERSEPVELSLVAHSLGGLVATQMTGNPDLRQAYADVLGHVQRMVLIAPADAAVHQENPVFVKVAKLHGYEVGVAKALQVLDAAAAEADLRGFCSTNRATRETAQSLAHVLGNHDHRLAAIAMLRQAVSWQPKGHRPDWAANKVIESHYRNITVPCLIVWGERDETLPESMGHKIKDHIAGAKLLTLPQCMHSPHLECPEETVRIIRAFNEPVPVVANIDR